MTPLAAALLAVILRWPVPGHELPEPRRERLTTIAQSVADESEAVYPTEPDAALSLASGVLTLWRAETDLDPEVHAGLRGRWGSDLGRARCLGQLHRVRIVPEWEELAGTDGASTARCARATIRVLRASGWRGRATAASAAWAFAVYALGHAPRGPVPFLGLHRARRWIDVRAAVATAARRGS